MHLMLILPMLHIRYPLVTSPYSDTLDMWYRRLKTKLEANESDRGVERACDVLYELCNIYTCSVLISLSFPVAFCLWNWNLVTITSYYTPVQ